MPPRVSLDEALVARLPLAAAPGQGRTERAPPRLGQGQGSAARQANLSLELLRYQMRLAYPYQKCFARSLATTCPSQNRKAVAPCGRAEVRSPDQAPVPGGSGRAGAKGDVAPAGLVGQPRLERPAGLERDLMKGGSSSEQGA